MCIVSLLQPLFGGHWNEVSTRTDSSVKYHLSKMLGGKGGLPPAWITDPSVEGPAGEETRGGAVVGIFTAEQVRAVIEFFTSC